jgi:hypothetical protein
LENTPLNPLDSLTAAPVTDPPPDTVEDRHWWWPIGEGLSRAAILACYLYGDFTGRMNGRWVTDMKASDQRRQQASPFQQRVITTTVTVTALLAVGTVAGTVAGVGMAVYDILDALLTAGIHGARASYTSGLGQTITRPAHAYLTAHATGLPITVGQAWNTWLTVLGGLLTWSTLLRSFGARLGWTAMGAASIAAVWAGSPAANAPVAAGLALAAWSVLSIPAFWGVDRRARLVIENHDGQ